MNRIAIAVAGALIGAAAFVQPAHASFTLNTVTLNNGDIFSGTCSALTSTTCSDLMMVLDPTGYGINIVNTTPGAPILTSASGDIDVSFDLVLTFPTTNHGPLTIGAAIVGSNGGVTANNNAATMSEEVIWPPPGGGNASTSVTLNEAEQDVLVPHVTAGFSSIDIDKDVKLTDAQIQNGTTVTVTSITQDLLVPEPASLGLLLAGIAAAAGVRRDRRRL